MRCRRRTRARAAVAVRDVLWQAGTNGRAHLAQVRCAAGELAENADGFRPVEFGDARGD